MSNKFYVYGLIDPRNNTPFYIGKGEGRRAYSHLTKNAKHTFNKRKMYIIEEIRNNNLEPEVHFYYKDVNEDIAYAIEEKLIKKYKKIDDGGILVNIITKQRKRKNIGLPKGYKFLYPRTKEHQQKLADSRRGKLWNEEQREKRRGKGNPFYGHKRSEEARKKTSKANYGANNQNALEWEITLPTGEIVRTKGLRTWCRENNYNFGTVYHSNKGFTAKKFGKGKGGKPRCKK